ncbi:single-stranded-DNA-specific exonuclease RecJ [Candidatus Kaiserbacteria bacterium RIFCSPHIGHO2_02_FULL_55_20]|uniref:Single-stranded-DNA-specific exonuclease RecJ n=1 Tax=Candidatus Kaiserbacteria bacterium RIFCSPHIGHO2_02_FULL_55_20 TaxID=1798497 RepID=A0A1F6DV55_9BACT|nr:MAG: single-stranded-DNA-specific exonuclease RecJ [Candidatus Kaiserbacteria bacterium RIFCSPHIGHO2_01_FULL_55_37]OGG65288.1 MAG: single-stranded-DNA-specific exonuclease RecJ [Candidatus Kaiserbacteria bacterium RIFCSPHIGHO2_02_FULL_55_20]
MHDLVVRLLAKRGISDAAEVSAFLNPDYELHTHDPFLLHGMDVAVARLSSAIEKNERIAVYADFDCDGIPGAALLSDLFNKIGYENFEVYLPHRDREGYGFHAEAIEALAARGVKLIITVDVGTTAIDAVAYAKEKGVDVIVTDHHEISGELPDAVAVLNPKIAPYPFPHLCGAAVAFKLAQALLRSPTGELRKGAAVTLAGKHDIPEGWEKWLLDMVAIATVADMVPLIGENRALTHWGLQVLRKSPRPGIQALCNKLRLRQNELSESDIGFSIAPRVNAASRMDEPDLALRLLVTRDVAEAESLAAQLEKLNTKRKGVVASLVKQARTHVKERYKENDRVVVLGNPEWKPALLGLAANSLMSDRGGIVCLWGRDANGKLKGSCRSDGDVSLAELFENAGDVFEECGGHAASGGFTVSHEQVHQLPEVLTRAAEKLPPRADRVALEHDVSLALSDISSALFREVSKLAPFGVGNPKPVFLLSNTTITGVKRFGKENNHVEVMLECRTSGNSARAFDFFKSPQDFSFEPEPGQFASLLATIERDSYRGGLALRIVDILPISV